jgi:hypothetical protein
MRTLSRRLALPLMLAASVAACSRSRAAVDEEARPATYVRVTNQAFLDMNVYVLRGGQRLRLGTVGANQTMRLRIPDNVVFGSTSLRFLADPIGSQRVSQSFDILVSPGDEVVMTIPPTAG